jgi:hypothetical protein
MANFGANFHSSGAKSVITDSGGNPIGVILDGAVYRLQVEAVLAEGEGSAHIEAEGTRDALAVSYPDLLQAVDRLLVQLKTINRQLAAMTGEDDPL